LISLNLTICYEKIKLSLWNAYFLSILILSSCSEETDVDPVVFSGIEVSQNFAFIEDVVVLNINASGYGEIELTSTSSEIVSITSVGDGIYEVSATEPVSVTIYVDLKDKNGDATRGFKTANVTFYEHGVKNFDTVEGIKMDRDRRGKVISLLGEPDYISVSSDSIYEDLYYFNLGVVFYLKNNKVGYAILHDSKFWRIIDGVKTYYTDYPYELPYGWKIGQITMDTVIKTLGAPDKMVNISDSNNLNYFHYTTEKFILYYYALNEQDYQGKKVRRVIID